MRSARRQRREAQPKSAAAVPRGVQRPTALIVLFALCAMASPASAFAQVGEPPYGILVMAHGGKDEWNQQVRDVVDSMGADVPVEIAFGMADRATLQTSVEALEADGVRRIVVVRLFVSGASFLPQTNYLLGLDPTVPELLYDSTQGGGMDPVADPSSVEPVKHRSEIVLLVDGLVDADVSGRILAQRALRLSSDPGRETVLVIAHGMADEDSNARLIEAIQERVEAIRRAASFRRVEVMTLREDWDEARAAAEVQIRETVQRALVDGDVIVIPFRVSGFGPYADVLEGLQYTADGMGLLPDPEIGEWILRSARLLACSKRWIVSPCDSRRR